MGTVAAERAPARAARALPAPGAVLREQFAVARLLLHELLVLVAAAMAGSTVLLSYSHVTRGTGADFVLPDMALAPVLAGLLAPLALWRSEGPARRAYFWAVPVDRLRHTLARLFAGWAWLMGATALYLAWGLALALATGSDVSVGVLRTRVLQPELLGGPRLVDLAMASHAWLWLVPFTSTTLAYLAISIPVLATDHPWRWFGGLAFAIVVAIVFLDAVGMGVPMILHDSAFGRFGIEAVLMGVSNQPVDPALVPPTAEGRLDLPDVEAWLLATAGWTLAAVAGVWLAARRLAER